MDAPPSVQDRSVRLRELKVCRVRPKSDTDLEDLITVLTSPDCAIETLDVFVTAYFYVYDGLEKRFATAIGGSKSLKSVEITAPRPMLDAVKLCELLKSNEVLESFKFAYRRRDQLLRLDSECWSDMLRENTKLRCLKLPSGYWHPNKLNKLLAVFSPDEATGHQDNKTLTTLEFCLVWAGQAIDVANMLLTNRTIQQLSLKGIHAPADIIHVLQALEGNNILQMLDLSRCLGVKEEQKLFDAILNCLQTNPWLHLNLEHTPLSKNGRRFFIIQQKLDQNMLFLRSWNQELVQSNGMRLFLCGSPRAGKTTLRQTLMQIAHHPKQHGRKAHFASLEPFHRIKALIDKKHDERTRGIEISIVEDANITISIWDMAGQEEFHAFHDYMMPNWGDVVSPCSFLFVFSPIMQKNEHDMHHHRRTWKELQEDLTYWLRFIASNNPTSTTFRPQLTVILTHVDKDPDASGLVMWAQSYVLNDLRNEFKGVVDISIEIHAINARSKKDVQHVLDFVFNCGRELLSKAPFVFAESAKMRQALAKRAKGHLYHPLISWNAFCKLCRKTIPEIYYGGNEAKNNDPFGPKDATIQMEEKTKVVATHLHATGDILYFKGLEWVVVDPNWFCHDVMGILIGFKDTQHQIINGFATKKHIEHILEQSLSLNTKNIASKLGISLCPSDLMQFMLHLNICYAKNLQNLDDGIFIPATLDAKLLPDKRTTIANGKRKLHWPIPPLEAPKNPIFFGRRLECNDQFHTFLTPGFFPKLQVVLHNAFTEFKNGNAHYELEKGLIIINFKGIEVLVECNEMGYYIDVLVRSSLNHGETLEIVNDDILKTIYQYCASNDGC